MHSTSDRCQQYYFLANLSWGGGRKPLLSLLARTWHKSLTYQRQIGMSSLLCHFCQASTFLLSLWATWDFLVFVKCSGFTPLRGVGFEPGVSELTAWCPTIHDNILTFFTPKIKFSFSNDATILKLNIVRRKKMQPLTYKKNDKTSQGFFNILHILSKH